MALPSRLKRQEDKANAFIQQRQENATRVANGQAPIPLPDPQPPAVVPQEEQELYQEQPGSELDTHLGALPEGEHPDDQPPPVAGQEELERLRARQSTTEGMLRTANTETATERGKREAAEAKAQREADRAAQLEQEIEDLRSRQPAAPVTRQDLLVYGFTEAEIDEDGEEKCIRLVNLSRNAAGAVVKAALAKARKDLDAEREQIRKDRETELAASQTERDARFWSDLTASVPTWRTINAKPEFLAWLGQPNPGDDRPRQAVLTEARQALNVARVAAIFNAFTQSQPRLAPAKDPKGILPGSRPAGPRSGEVPREGTVSRAEIREHQKKLSTGKYRNSSEAMAMQQKIDKAAAEHRIVE